VSINISPLCGDDFYRNLTTHPTVEEIYMNAARRTELLLEGLPDYFDYGDIRWYRYLSEPTVDLSIPTNQCRFFPIGGMDVFSRINGPGSEFIEFINQPGRDIYALTIPDRDRGSFDRVEYYAFPLYVCLRPEMLQKGMITKEEARYRAQNKDDF